MLNLPCHVLTVVCVAYIHPQGPWAHYTNNLYPTRVLSFFPGLPPPCSFPPWMMRRKGSANNKSRHKLSNPSFCPYNHNNHLHNPCLCHWGRWGRRPPLPSSLLRRLPLLLLVSSSVCWLSYYSANHVVRTPHHPTHTRYTPPLFRPRY